MGLELINVKKSFVVSKDLWGRPLDLVRAVDGVSLNIRPGENVGLVGESGCGKTTLARAILGLLPLDEGRVVFDGQEISSFSAGQMRSLRKDLQIVFQDPFSSLDPRFTIERIMAEGLRFDRARGLRAGRLDIQETLKAVRLPANILGRFPHEFSGGERQRIAIARALVMRPRFLILDEPVSSLDVLVQEEILQLLADVREKFGVTYLFISHNLRVVKKICEKIVVMSHGRVVEEAPREALFNDPCHPYTRQLLSAAFCYEVKEEAADIALTAGARMVDRGNNHFVLEA